MKKITLILTAIMAFCLSVAAQNSPRKGRWTKEQAWEWYNAQPWIRGCNYMSADCANRVDQWQELGFEERFETQRQELALAQSIGFNTVRLLIAEEGFGIWIADHDGFMQRFDRTLALCFEHGIRAIVTLANDCSRPKELWKLPQPGPQHYDWGYHGGRKQSQHGTYPGAIGFTSLDDPELSEAFFQMCREIMTVHKDDQRILFWDLINEPGANNRKQVSVANVRRLFEIGWEVNPSQPLTADLWNSFGKGEKNPSENAVAELCDIISYHDYSPLKRQKEIAEDLRERIGRPMINTEWLARIRGNYVQDCYAFFEQERIGCTMWGFVAGKYQTYEPWESMWKEIDAGKGKHYEITKWFHDLYRPSLRPYDPEEIAIISHINAQADDEFANKGAYSIRQNIARSHKILSEDIWNGYRRTEFDFEGHKAWVVEPAVSPLQGRPWTWTTQWAEAYVDRTGVLDLLKEGFHHVTIDIFEERGSDEAVALMARFQDFLRTELGFCPQARLIGLSWGGFFAVRYAAAYPQNVARIYLDAPLLCLGREFKGDIGPWKDMKKGKWSKDARMPV
ncbi:MAG: alpha/beta fold hydrolase, partial [Bacteroidales bacterium]|nr:alpha/beta fold hydrolase [Candidatus Cryptobacteroides equifaecalis]